MVGHTLLVAGDSDQCSSTEAARRRHIRIWPQYWLVGDSENRTQMHGTVADLKF
jgi:hypothetical protein